MLATGWLGIAGALTAAAVYGACYMALTGLLVVWAVREQPHRPGAAVGSAFLALAAGQIAGAPLAGAIVDLVGPAPAFAAVAAIAVLGLLTRPGPPPLPAGYGAR